MKILLTNFRLAERTASEVYIRDIARMLQSLGGHEVAVFVSQKGNLARDLDEVGIQVFCHPVDCPWKPDVIHGQYNLETIAALLAYPDRPGIYMSHGTRQWRELPPPHPRIHRYIAHSDNVVSWMANEMSLKANQFERVPNFVDLERFEQVRRLPEQPARALFYDRSTSAGSHLNDIRSACQRCGVELDFVDELVGKKPTSPEVILPEYDLVFASGRSAMEALASGCGVITAKGKQWGQLITTNNFEAVRNMNFSVDENAPPSTVEQLVNEIESWDWRSMAPVTRRLREELDSNSAGEALIKVYEKVILEHKEIRNTARGEFPPLTDWLIQLAEQHHSVDSGFLAIQHRVSNLKNVRDEAASRKDELEQLLEQEKAKVRAARRHLKDGNIMHQRLWKKIEAEWREIEKGSDIKPRGNDHPSDPGQNPGSSTHTGSKNNTVSPPPGRLPRSGIELPR